MEAMYLNGFILPVAYKR